MIAKVSYQVKWYGPAVVAVDEQGPSPVVEIEYITLAQAAAIAGYKSTSTLHKAAREGRLKTVLIGPYLHFTTREWLDEYLAGIRASKSRRGQPRSGGTPPDA
jgi:hypothetical protein